VQPSGWLIPRHSLQIGKTIGVGVYGNVVEATLDGMRPVALRLLQHTRLISAYTAELEVMKSLGRDPHLNVLGLVGMCEDSPRCIVVPLASSGNLLQFLRQNRATASNAQRITLADLGRFSLQILDGLRFLASKDILHQNLRARSILLDSSYTCMVGPPMIRPVFSPSPPPPDAVASVNIIPGI